MVQSLRYINYLKIYGTAGAVLGLVPGLRRELLFFVSIYIF